MQGRGGGGWGSGGVGGARKAYFPLFLRMKHILDTYENVTGRRVREVEFCLRVKEVTKK